MPRGSAFSADPRLEARRLLAAGAAGPGHRSAELSTRIPGQVHSTLLLLLRFAFFSPSNGLTWVERCLEKAAFP